MWEMRIFFREFHTLQFVALLEQYFLSSIFHNDIDRSIYCFYGIFAIKLIKPGLEITESLGSVHCNLTEFLRLNRESKIP